MDRRRLLQLGLGATTILAVGGGALALLQPGVQEGRLTATGRLVFTHAARGLLEGALPAGATDQTRALEGLMSRIDALVQTLPGHAQAELSQLLAVLGSAPGRRALAGLSSPWAQATVPEIQASLQAMRISSLALRQQGYQALHDITASGWFADRSTWSWLGYPGPTEV